MLRTIWDWMTSTLGLSIIGSVIAALLVGLLAWFRKKIWRWITRNRRKQTAPLKPGFPFDVAKSAREAAQKAPNFSVEELYIPYQERVEEAEQAELRSTLDNDPFLLIRGRTGLGKTREALEIIDRMQRRFGEVTILIPRSSLSLPPFDWPSTVATRHIVLYVDNLHERFFSPPKEGERYAVAGDFRTWFQSAVEHLRNRFPGSDFKVVAIVRDDIQDAATGANWREKIGYSPTDPFWNSFTVVQLPDCNIACRRHLVDACAAWRQITIDDDSADALAAKTDGTAGAIVAPIGKKSPGETVSLDEVKGWPGSFEGQAARDWQNLIAPYPSRRVIFEAISLLKQAGMTPHADLTLELAAGLLGWPVIVNRLKVRRSTAEVDTWIKVKDRILDCPEEYYKDKLSLPDNSTMVVNAVHRIWHRDPIRFAPEFGSLGHALVELASGDRRRQLEEAIACYGRALEMRTKEAFPTEWAATQNSLGIAYSGRIKGAKADNMEKAIACFSRVPEVYTKETFPMEWATMQNNLGAAYSDRIKGEKADNLEKAIACYGRALEVHTKGAFPMGWAMTQNNLGVANSDRIRGGKADNLEKAIACFSRALEVYTKEAFPMDWAMTRNNLGNAYRNRIKGAKADNLEKAIACYGRALEVYTKETFPMDWAMTRNNLGNAYINRTKGDKADNLEKAIACYGRALEVQTKETFPTRWAMTQNNLGVAYGDRIKGEKADNLEKAIACYGRALEVRTKEAFPMDWAMTQNNLGAAYGDRIKGEKADNLEKAIACYGRALEVYTKEAFPVDWADVQSDLDKALKTLQGIKNK